eukprot:jgi/Botrbrau1/11052/Bobra.92_2s0023.1
MCTRQMTDMYTSLYTDVDHQIKKLASGLRRSLASSYVYFYRNFFKYLPTVIYMLSGIAILRSRVLINAN